MSEKLINMFVAIIIIIGVLKHLYIIITFDTKYNNYN